MSQFLDYAELQALEQRPMKMTDWVIELDNQIKLNRRKILEGNGKISHEEAIKKAEKEFNIYREREMKMLESDFDYLIKQINNKDMYYRITYKGKGIYEALKEIVGIDIWKKFLNDENIKWLPKPPSYKNNNISYFTKKGCEIFKEKTLPLFCNYLENDKILIETKEKLNNNILYSDEYQIVIDIDD